MTALTLPGPAGTAARMSPLLAVRDFAGVARRNLLRDLRSPQTLVYSVMEPVMMLVLFRYIFAGAIRIPGISYVDFVVPSIFLMAVMVGVMTSAIGTAEDLKSGMLDRFRSLPMARPAVLAGRSISDVVRSVIGLAFTVGLGVAVGFRFHDGAGPILAGMALILAFGYSFTWLNVAVGMSTKDPQAATSAGMMPYFILLFAGNALVPTPTLPWWLRAFARNQPLSVTTSAVRALFEGGAAAHWVWLSLAWSAGITVVFALISLALYRNATAH